MVMDNIFQTLFLGQKTPAQLSKEFINVPNKYMHYVEMNVGDHLVILKLETIKQRRGIYVY